MIFHGLCQPICLALISSMQIWGDYFLPDFPSLCQAGCIWAMQMKCAKNSGNIRPRVLSKLDAISRQIPRQKSVPFWLLQFIHDLGNVHFCLTKEYSSFSGFIQKAHPLKPFPFSNLEAETEAGIAFWGAKRVESTFCVHASVLFLFIFCLFGKTSACIRFWDWFCGRCSALLSYPKSQNSRRFS